MNAQYNRFVAEYREARCLAAELGMEAERLSAHENEQVFQSRTDVAPTEADPYADATAQHALEAEYRGRLKELETALCELRTRFCTRLQQRGKSYTGTTMAALVREQGLHRAHRQEDRMQWLAWLEKHREYVEYELTEGARAAPGRVDLAALRQLALRLTAEIARIKALDETQLTTDREALKAHVELYAVPYLPG